MSVQEHDAPVAQAQAVTRENVYQSLFKKIHLTPVSSLKQLGEWQDSEAMAEASTEERVSAAIQVLLSCVAKSGKNVEKLDKSLLDFHISELADPALLETLGVNFENLIVAAAAVAVVFVCSVIQENSRKTLRESICCQSFYVQAGVFLLLFWVVAIFGVYGPGTNPAEFVYMQF